MEPKNQTLIVHTDTRTEYALPPDRYFHKENKSHLSTKKDYYHLLQDRTGKSMHPRLLPSVSVTLSVRSKRVEPDSEVQPKTVTQVTSILV